MIDLTELLARSLGKGKVGAKTVAPAAAKQARPVKKATNAASSKSPAKARSTPAAAKKRA